VRFAEASVLRMLDFVDNVADAALNDDQAAAETLPGMLQVYTYVVDDSPSPAIPAVFKEAQGTASIFDAMNGVFLRKRSKLSDAVWSMVEKVRASFMADDCRRRRRGGGGGREGRRPAVCLAYASEWTRLRKVGSALSVEPEPCNRLNT